MNVPDGLVNYAPVRIFAPGKWRCTRDGLWAIVDSAGAFVVQCRYNACGKPLITCTTEHPFYVHGKGWVAAQSLVVGDKIELQSGEDAYVDAIEYEKLAVPIQVYNFEVYEFHTYYVGSACVLVRNACSQRAAMRQAKMSENIPLSQRPDRVEMVRMIGANGKSVTAKLEVYGNKFIRNDIGGHLFKDGGTMARHFNAGTVKMVGKATKYISNGKHFFY